MAMNTAATSCFTVGVLAPIAASLYALGPAPATLRVAGLIAAGWIVAAVLLHYIARRVLRSLRP